MTDTIIKMNSFESDRAFFRKCYKKTLKALIPRQCLVCGGPAESRCGRCKLVRYCSPQCKNHDWKTHKLTC